MAVAASLIACGGSSSGATERSGTYAVAVTEASLPRVQRLGQTSSLELAIRNEGDETVPALTVTIGIEGERGESSALPFGIRDPQPGLASPDRPVWVLAQSYPRLASSSRPGGATTANPKTFDFGPLEPGETTAVVWKLSAVRAGRYTVAYLVGAGGGEAVAETDGGEVPEGALTARITAALPETEVNDRGEVVKIKGSRRP